MALLMQVVIVDGGSSTTLCDGVGYRDSNHWAYLDLQIPARYLKDIARPVRAAFQKPLTRVSIGPQLRLRVERLYATPEAAIAARLVLPATAPTKGVITITVATGTTVVCSDCAIDACQPVTNGCTLTVDWTYECGQVAAGA